MMDATTAAKLLLDSKANTVVDGHKNWKAIATMRKAENALIRAGMTLCPTCRGVGEIRTKIAPKSFACGWCSGTGYDDERHKACSQCNGKGECLIDQFAVDTCNVCKGNRVIPCKEKLEGVADGRIS